MQTNIINYDRRAIIENFINKILEWKETHNKNKEEIVNEAVNVVESLLESNALSVKELNQRVVDETLNELATKDFVRAEIEKLRAEIIENKAEIRSIKQELKFYAIGLGILIILLQPKVFDLIGALFSLGK